ncbi:MAG: RNA pseudouridine synthase [Deltaproteobacteria bacterium]|nr:RNA pseudouridine synthase [Deltaproteobacteria bacterium]
MTTDAYRYNPPVKYYSFTLEKTISGRNLLPYLSQQLNLATENIQKALFHGGCYLNKKRLNEQDLKHPFKANSEIELYLFSREPEAIPISSQHILLKENGLLAVNKPAWLPVQGSRASTRFGLQEQVRDFTGLKNLNALHRLDRQTSGIVLFAYDKKTEAYFMKQFHDQKIKKSYLALVSPAAAEKEWIVEGYLQRDFRKLPLNVYRLYEKEQKNSRWSKTEFKVLEANEKVTLIEARPLTGRTHQIRVHLASKGHPILGDDLYGSPLQSTRILLHAHRLSFQMADGKEVRIEAPVPGDFN